MHDHCLTVPDTPAFRAVIEWLRELGARRRVGIIRDPAGEEFVVMLPECLAELDEILSDPAFLAHVESGADDVSTGRVRRMERGRGLDAVGGVADADAASCQEVADAIERGVADLLGGRSRTLDRGGSLGDAM